MKCDRYHTLSQINSSITPTKQNISHGRHLITELIYTEVALELQKNQN
jgi:hypothetical protein